GDGPADPGVGDHDLQPAVLGHGLVDQALDLLLAADVAGDGRRPRDPGGGLLGQTLVDVGHDHGGALAGVGLGDGLPDPLAGAGDDGDLAFQAPGHHRITPT